MGVISIYNKYIDRGYSYTRMVPDGGRGPQHDSRSKGLFKNFDLNSILGGILPEGIDSGDIMLLLLLLFLYIETDDNDFLILLAVIAFSVIKGD